MLSVDRGISHGRGRRPESSCAIDVSKVHNAEKVARRPSSAEELFQLANIHDGSVFLDTLPKDAMEDVTQKRILDFNNNRQTCLAVADATSKKDAERLENLSQDPKFASRVRSVRFNLGHLCFKQVERLALSFLVENELHPSYDSAMQAKHWECLRTDLEAGKATPILNIKAFQQALNRLPHLDSLHLTWIECPWEDKSHETGELFDPVASIQLAGKEVTKMQQWVLEALENFDICISRLVLEPLVVSDLAIPSSLDAKAMMSFERITELGLTILHTEEPFQQDKLEYFLSLMPNLADLRIHALPGDQTPSDLEFLPRTYLPYLQKLDLQGLPLRLDSFAAFLHDHCKTITELRLGSLNGQSPSENPSTADWDMIFRLIQQECTELRHVSINGIFKQEGNVSLAFYHPNDPISVLDDGLWTMSAEAMEKYLLQGGAYPQPKRQNF
ncbi:Fc.00g089180.m01.CDS01 [Cosmosporella sp. VM-42]